SGGRRRPRSTRRRRARRTADDHPPTSPSRSSARRPKASGARPRTARATADGPPRSAPARFGAPTRAGSGRKASRKDRTQLRRYPGVLPASVFPLHTRVEASALEQPTLGVRGPTPLLRLQGDERLVALTRKGNQAAYEALVARYQSR